jgi:hypothetical protein
VWNTTFGERRRRCARGGFRALWRIASLSACSAVVLLASCGGAERSGIPSGTAEALARQSDGIAVALERGDRCEAARLADELLTTGRAARLPRAYRSPLLDTANSLAARVNCPPPPPPAPPEKHEKKHHKKKGHG